MAFFSACGRVEKLVSELEGGWALRSDWKRQRQSIRAL